MFCFEEQVMGLNLVKRVHFITFGIISIVFHSPFMGTLSSKQGFELTMFGENVINRKYKMLIKKFKQW